MPKLMSPLKVITSGTRFLTKRVRRSVWALAELLMLTLMVLLLKVGDHGLELVGGLGLELEEIQRDGACGAGAAACQAEPDGDRAHHGGGAHGQTLQSRRCMWGIGQHNC